MPSEDWEDSLEYNKYIKKLLIRAEDTQDCIEGCYLLMSIQISQIGEYVDESKFYPFLILTRITPNNRAYTDIPKVVIQVDEYIIEVLKKHDNKLGVTEIGHLIHQKFSNFSPKDYGYSQLTKYVQSIPSIKITHDDKQRKLAKLKK